MTVEVEGDVSSSLGKMVCWLWLGGGHRLTGWRFFLGVPDPALLFSKWQISGVKKRSQNLLDMTWQDFLSEQGRARLASLSIDGEHQRHRNAPSGN
jgi:hypothetical protein